MLHMGIIDHVAVAPGPLVCPSLDTRPPSVSCRSARPRNCLNL